MILNIRKKSQTALGVFGECTSKELEPYIGKRIFIPDNMIKILPDENKSK